MYSYYNQGGPPHPPSQHPPNAPYYPSLYGAYPPPPPPPLPHGQPYHQQPPPPQHIHNPYATASPLAGASMPPPGTYVCHSCGQRGLHWVTQCPTVTGGGASAYPPPPPLPPGPPPPQQGGHYQPQHQQHQQHQQAPPPWQRGGGRMERGRGRGRGGRGGRGRGGGMPFHQQPPQQQQQQQQQPPSPYTPAPPSPPVPDAEDGEGEGGSFVCEPCDKAFQTEAQQAAHVASHEKCNHPGCAFMGSKQVVVGHYRVAHGKYKGNGFRVMNVEGRKFRILVGNAPEEVEQWRQERRKNFPTAEAVARKQGERRGRGGGGGGRGSCGVGDKRGPAVDGCGARVAKQARRTEKKEEEGGGGGGLLGHCYDSDAEEEDKGLSEAATAPAADDDDAKKEQVDHTQSLLHGVCRAYLRSQCPLSAARCRYRHGPSKGPGPSYCRFYTKPGGTCNHGDGCQYVHDAALKAELEKWVADRRAQNKEEREKERAAGGGGERKQAAAPAGGGRNQQAAARGPRSREPTLLKRLLGMEMEKETRLVLGCIRFLVQSDFLKKQVVAGTLPAPPQTPKLVEELADEEEEEEEEEEEAVEA